MYCSSASSKEQIVLYQHADSRGNEVPSDFLRDFQGYLHCDGWRAYELLENTKVVNCLAHVRRKFKDGIPADDKNPNLPSRIGFEFCNLLFKTDKIFQTLSVEERKVARQTELKPIFDKFYAWIESVNILPKSKFARAVEYAARHKKGCMRVLEDGRLELSNNLADRMIKELVMGRKNWLFSTSFEGARTSGVILSIMKTAELNQLNVRKYFEFLFDEIPNLPVLTQEAIEVYLPWSELVKERCY
ncbi:MAG: IS66 family transposase [Lactobacillales bacterium]|jgi:hypothetical protein|nr:IS66 family transposase [Lactobacillales bacterium]